MTVQALNVLIEDLIKTQGPKGQFQGSFDRGSKIDEEEPGTVPTKMYKGNQHSTCSFIHCTPNLIWHRTMATAEKSDDKVSGNGEDEGKSNQSLEVQSKPIFNPFSSKPSSPTIYLVAQSGSVGSGKEVGKTDMTSESNS